MRHNLKKAWWQAPALVLLALMVALGVNLLRSDGLSLTGDPPSAADLGAGRTGEPVVDLAEARRRFDHGDALFVDARPGDQYASGHIRGALNLAWPQAEQSFVDIAERLDAAKTIITYCDGETCTLSHELAHFLIEMGFGDVRVLVNGWTLWQQAGLPVDMKASGDG